MPCSGDAVSEADAVADGASKPGFTVRALVPGDQEAVFQTWWRGWDSTIHQLSKALWRTPLAAGLLAVPVLLLALPLLLINRRLALWAVSAGAVAVVAVVWLLPLPRFFTVLQAACHQLIRLTCKDMWQICNWWTEQPDRGFYVVEDDASGEVVAAAALQFGRAVWPADVPPPAAAASWWPWRHGGSSRTPGFSKGEKQQHAQQLGSDDVVLYRMAVHESRRRQGLGGLLLRHVVEVARGAGARRMLLGTGNADAVVFYQTCGFTRLPAGHLMEMDL